MTSRPGPGDIAGNVARSLNDKALADRLIHLAADVRWTTPAERAAVLTEAAARLSQDPAQRVLAWLLAFYEAGSRPGGNLSGEDQAAISRVRALIADQLDAAESAATRRPAPQTPAG